MTEATFTQITTDRCDDCGSRGPISLHHHNGTPVLGICRGCDPQTFEEQARRDIDAWLNGGPADAFGRS